MTEHYLPTKNYKLSNSYTDSIVGGTKDLILSRSWGPLLSISRNSIIALLERIQIGRLRILSSSGTFTFGKGGDNSPSAEIKVHNEQFWLRMVALADLGFAESYMAQEIDVDSLENVFKIFIQNRRHLSELDTGASKIFSSISYLLNSKFINSLSNAISNISAHYDISNQMFEAFLSNDMTYSCAIFPSLDASAQETPSYANAAKEDPLEVAQLRKIHRILDLAQVSSGHRVLEIGSGWGSCAIEAARRGATVDTLTLSVEQQQLAQNRIKAAGFEDQITVHLLDYRAMPESWKGSFDRVVSIEMIEAVGLEFMEGYFTAFNQALKNGGYGTYQVITIPENRFERYRYEIDFIRKYIFPGGVLPSVTFLTNALTVGSKGELVTESIENIGPHYTRTLREWRARFLAKFDTHIVPALKEAYPNLKKDHEVETFKRKWIYYFDYCAAGFEERSINDHIFTVRKQ